MTRKVLTSMFLISMLCLTTEVRAATNEAQIGSEWSRERVNAHTLSNKSPEFIKSVLTTGVFRGYTTFFVGRMNEQYMFVTSNRAIKDQNECTGRNVEFPILRKKITCTKLFGIWPEAGVAVFSAMLYSRNDRQVFEQYVQPLAFASKVKRGQLLTAIGFGTMADGKQALTANFDSDCKVVSGDAEDRRVTVGAQSANVFATGCDLSEGDAGAALTDRTTGEVLGLAWGSPIPKPAEAQDSAFVESQMRSPTEAMWTALSYAVPVWRIKEAVSRSLDQNMIKDRDSLAILKTFVGRDSRPAISTAGRNPSTLAYSAKRGYTVEMKTLIGSCKGKDTEGSMTLYFGEKTAKGTCVDDDKHECIGRHTYAIARPRSSKSTLAANITRESSRICSSDYNCAEVQMSFDHVRSKDKESDNMILNYFQYFDGDNLSFNPHSIDVEELVGKERRMAIVIDACSYAIINFTVTARTQ